MDILKKYDDLIDDISTIKSVASELVDIIGRNNASIKWYREYMAEQIGKNPDYDCSYNNEAIEALERQNAIVKELERSLWASHVSKPYVL